MNLGGSLKDLNLSVYRRQNNLAYSECRMEPTLKGKNLLLVEQILSFKN